MHFRFLLESQISAEAQQTVQATDTFTLYQTREQTVPKWNAAENRDLMKAIILFQTNCEADEQRSE